MFYRKTIKELKEQIDLLKGKNYNLLRDNELLKKEVAITRNLSFMEGSIADLKQEFKFLRENIIGRIIK